MQGIAITHVYPDALQAKHLIVRNYQLAMRAMNQSEFTTGSLEGYISTRLMAEAMQRAGRNVTRERVKQALASIRNYGWLYRELRFDQCTRRLEVCGSGHHVVRQKLKT